jgi:hypothetical protein
MPDLTRDLLVIDHRLPPGIAKASAFEQKALAILNEHLWAFAFAQLDAPSWM